MKNENEVTAEDIAKRPLYTLTVGEFESLIKSWIKDCLDYNPTQTANMPKYLTRIEAAKLLQISLPTLSSYINLGIIPAKRVGTRVLFDEVELRDAVKQVPIKLSRR